MTLKGAEFPREVRERILAPAAIAPAAVAISSQRVQRRGSRCSILRSPCLRTAVIALTVLGAVAMAAGAVAWHVRPFPLERLDRWPVSPVVTDGDGNPILRIVGSDDHWRFPVPLAEISPWLQQATIATEDARFYRHIGADPLAIVRALGQNTASGRTVSGASTLTMQICRMMDDRPRTLSAKLVETFRALQLERTCGKEQILETYLNVAPYGGNLRGAEAASRLYFGKRAADLSLGEAALLAGLPQAPGRYRPDRHSEAARARRSHVLHRMTELEMITPDQAAIADAEPVASLAGGLSVEAPHVAWLALGRRPGGGRTTIAAGLQAEAERLVADHAATLPADSQVAAVIIDIRDSEIVALVGSADRADPVAGLVNGVTARRSPGSALKPFIYAAAAEAGLLNDETTVYDVPIQRAGWSPANFYAGSFAGPLTAGDALRRSLNVPAILVAEAAGLPRCLGLIEAAGVRLPGGVQTRGGLSVVVGTAEVTLLDLANGYATLGRGGIRRTPKLFPDEPAEPVRVLDGRVCAMIDDILSSRHRRPRSMMSRRPGDVPWFMWKTGTSSGRRDAVAAGHNGRYAAGVWVGRFPGAGSPHFLGAEAAEPLLAAIFDLPAVRRVDDPPAPDRLQPRQPLAPPIELTGPLRILSPTDGASYIALGSGATVELRANRGDGLTWFLNGVLLDGRADGAHTLTPGSYTARCVDAANQATSVRFTVRSLPGAAARTAR